ncbi:MAG: ubiquinone biosynthesis accessory factor UbiJ [Steroidobacteraceae bacterium]
MIRSTLENLLNRGLPRSVRARQLCTELDGRRLAVEAPDLLRLLIESTGTSLRLRRGSETADASIVGGPLSLLVTGAALSGEPLRRGTVEIRGDVEIAEKFQELLRLLTPDLEEELALLVGDVPAHRAGQLVRGTLRWSRSALDALWRDIGEYASHERRDLVSRPEGEAFLRDVDALREDVDRLAARLELLERRAAAP